MATLLSHRDVIYEDDTVMLAGNAFFGCRFERCTLILGDAQTLLQECVFVSCIWHINLMIHDEDGAKRLRDLLPLLEKGLPSSPSILE